MSAILLLDPKFPHNVGGAIRACAVFGVTTLRWTGDRVPSPTNEGGGRFPREERMKEYRHVKWRHERDPHPVTKMAAELELTPIAVEIRDGAEELGIFEHPNNPLYVFGPEDGSLGRQTLGVCHRFLRIPSVGCLNLSAAVNVVLYDRLREEAALLRSL